MPWSIKELSNHAVLDELESQTDRGAALKYERPGWILCVHPRLNQRGDFVLTDFQIDHSIKPLF